MKKKKKKKKEKRKKEKRRGFHIANQKKHMNQDYLYSFPSCLKIQTGKVHREMGYSAQRDKVTKPI